MLRPMIAVALTLTALSTHAADLARDIDAVFAQWNTTVTPGCTVAASQNGAIVFKRGYGLANMEHGIVNRPETIVHIASVSKQFAAAAIAMLVLEKRIALTDSVRKYIPELHAVTQPVTIAHLVHHTSGLKDFSDLMDLAGWRYYQDLVTSDDAMSVLAKQHSMWFEPGSQYQYNNSNYLLLGQIVQRVTGKSLRDFAQERIFAPLGMRDTQFRDHFPSIVPRFASGYSPVGDDGFETSLTNFSTDGYSGVLTTVEDLMKWEENWYRGTVGGKPLLDLMLTRAPLNDGKPNNYAFGVVVDWHRGLQTVDHSGGDAGYSSYMVRFPERRTSVAVLCNVNSADAHRLALRTADVVLGLPEEKHASGSSRASKVSARELEAKAGHYYDRDSEQSLTVRFKDGQLVVVADDEERLLTPATRTRFEIDENNSIDFASANRATVRRYDESRTLERIDYRAPTADELQRYVGTYVSDELDAPFRVAVVAGRLEVRSIKFKTMLSHVHESVFKAGWYNARFEAKNGVVTGMRLGAKPYPLAQFVKRD